MRCVLVVSWNAAHAKGAPGGQAGALGTCRARTSMRYNGRGASSPGRLREIGEAYGHPDNHSCMRCVHGGNRDREFGQKGVTNGLVAKK